MAGLYSGNPVFLGEVEFAVERMKEKDLLLAISLSGENKESMDVVRAVQKAGVQTISFTRWENNSLARLCQESLYVGTRTISQSSGRTAARAASSSSLKEFAVMAMVGIAFAS